jgi:hypothetical protein
MTSPAEFADAPARSPPRNTAVLVEGRVVRHRRCTFPATVLRAQGENHNIAAKRSANEYLAGERASGDLTLAAGVCCAHVVEIPSFATRISTMS